MGRRKRGPCADGVEFAVLTWRAEQANAAFVDSLSRLVSQYGPYPVALALRRSIVAYVLNDEARVWQLADQADPEIRKKWHDYRESFL